jgi:uncharacterized protein
MRIASVIVLTCIALFNAHTVGAQNEQSLLWKITGKEIKSPCYLFGTMHSNDPTINVFDSVWWNAIRSCDVLATEVNMSDPSELMGSLAAGMMKDTTLSDLFNEAEFARVSKFVNAQLDPFTATIVMKMKPFYILAAIMEKPQEDSPFSMVMDVRLSQMADERGARIVGLETMKEQAASINVLNLPEQAELLLDYVDNADRYEKEGELMVQYYRSQMLDSLESLGNQFEAPDKLMKSILEDRNKRFTERLIPLLASGKVFCAVGALHLTGQTGMVAALRREGYRLELVSFQFVE